MSITVSVAKLRRKAVRRKAEKLSTTTGQAKPRKATIPNHNSVWKTTEEEIAGRQQAVEETLTVFRQLLPGLLHDLAKIEDPRHTNKVKHKLTVLLLYVDEVSSKQDCELKAFHRMAARLKKAFPRLPVTLLLDGLYANGPVIALCRKNRWEFMIVLQNGSLPSVWKEANALQKLHPDQTFTRMWKGRHQTFWFTNDIEYVYGMNSRLKQIVHVVVCEETWEEVNADAHVVTQTSRHAWLSSEPLHERNLHVRCNEMARSRWGLENDILQEKRQGYQYEHVFAYDWNAMRGYHYLMHLAHLMNEIVGLVEVVVTLTSELGIRGFLRLLRETISGPWLNHDRIWEWREQKPRLRFAS